MKPNRYRTNKAANMVAVVFALGTAFIITRSVPLMRFATPHAHATPQPHTTAPLQREPDVHDTVTPRPHVRLWQA